jgi:hypothetical protein
VDHSPPSSAEVKNEWSHSSAPLMCLHGVDRDNFTLSYFLSVVSELLPRRIMSRTCKYSRTSVIRTSLN